MTQQILVVDPNKPNRTVVKLLLSNHDTDCVEASDVESAVELLKSNKFDAIFCCMTLAENSKALNGNAPLIFMATAGQKDQIQTMNLKSYLLKPITPSRLDEKLKEIFPHYNQKKSAV